MDGWPRQLARRDLKGRQCLWWVTETAEDISPYATFQLSEGGGGSLAGLGALGGLGGAAEATAAGLHPNNTLLHSFMYHEHAMTEGCASPPPAATVYICKISSFHYDILLITQSSFEILYELYMKYEILHAYNTSLTHPTLLWAFSHTARTQQHWNNICWNVCAVWVISQSVEGMKSREGDVQVLW